MFAPTAETFRQFLEQQDFFVFVVTIYVGAGLIANDRRANALQIYLSKPLMRTEYIFGKAAILFAFLLFVTLVPAMLLLFAAGDVRRQLRVPEEEPVPVSGDHRRRAAAGGARRPSRCWRCRRCRRAAATSAFCMPASSSSPRRSTARCWRSPGSTRLSWLSLGANLTQVVDVIFRLKPRYATPWPVSLIVILGLGRASISVLERRVRGVEVVT